MRTSLLSFLTLMLLEAALAIRASPMGIVHTITVENTVNGDDDYKWHRYSINSMDKKELIKNNTIMRKQFLFICLG